MQFQEISMLPTPHTEGIEIFWGMRGGGPVRLKTYFKNKKLMYESKLYN